MKDNYNRDDSRNGSDRDTLYLMGGIAPVAFGAGLILTNKNVRRLIGQVSSGALKGASVPDFERYMKLRTM